MPSSELMGKLIGTQSKPSVDKFATDIYTILHPSCETCVHRSKVDFSLCLAFPEGIPLEILDGTNKHTEPYDGDDGITYEQKT